MLARSRFRRPRAVRLRTKSARSPPLPPSHRHGRCDYIMAPRQRAHGAAASPLTFVLGSRRILLSHACHEFRHFGQGEVIVQHVVQPDPSAGDAQHHRHVVPLGVVERTAGLLQPTGRVHAEARPLQALGLQRRQFFRDSRAARRLYTTNVRL